MIKNLLVVGSSGSGKSTSLRNLPLEKTIWINTEKKSLPFRGQKKLLKNISLKSVDEMLQGMKWIEEQEDCEYVVLDSFTMLMDMFYMEKIATAPANKTMQMWGEYKVFAMNIVELMKSSNKFYIVTALNQIEKDRFGSPENEEAKVQGSFKLEPHFTVVAHTHIFQNPETKHMSYGLLLGRTDDKPLISAKSPFDFLDGKKELDDNDITVVTNEVISFIED